MALLGQESCSEARGWYVILFVSLAFVLIERGAGF
jgi:hypothetical protein